MIKKLVFVIMFILVTLLLGSLFGIQHMNEELGITKPVPLELKESEAAGVPSEPEVISAKKEQPADPKSQLVEKRQKAEDVGRFNFFSELGTGVAEGANRISRMALTQVMTFVHEVLNGESSE